MTKRQAWIVTGVAVVVTVAVVVGYFVLKAHDEPAPPSPRPIAKPSAPVQTPQQPDSAVIDNRRRTAAAATLTMLQSYAQANNGKYPATADELRGAVDIYGKMIASSTTVVYKSSYDPADVPKPTDMFYYPGYACTGADPTPSPSRSVAVRYVLSNSAYECVAS